MVVCATDDRRPAGQMVSHHDRWLQVKTSPHGWCWTVSCWQTSRSGCGVSSASAWLMAAVRVVACWNHLRDDDCAFCSSRYVFTLFSLPLLPTRLPPPISSPPCPPSFLPPSLLLPFHVHSSSTSFILLFSPIVLSFSPFFLFSLLSRPPMPMHSPPPPLSSTVSHCRWRGGGLQSDLYPPRVI